MELHELLLSKNGLATIEISRKLLSFNIGNRIPTISEFCAELDLARGTAQNALKTLVDNDAIRYDSKGHLGSYLTRKNTKLLLEFAGFRSIVGAMPLPYSKRYEGLATGLIAAMENSYDLPVNLAYMRGASNRISMVAQGRYDFAVVSRFAANDYIEKHGGINIVMGFGEESYVSNHVLMFHNPKDKEVKNGMRIGIDIVSVDQKKLTEMACAGKNVEYVPMDYSHMVDAVISGTIDAVVMNYDEPADRHLKINAIPIEGHGAENTEAVIVIRDDANEISTLLNEFINKEAVLSIQKLVMEGKITPSY